MGRGAVALRRAEEAWLEEAVARRAAASGSSAAVLRRRMLARLSRGEPLQYVLGSWSFRGHELRVDRRALIPRFETEQLVELVLEVVRPGMRVVDVGTGSGAIAISLALEAPGVSVIATDLDPRALALARENVRALGAAVELRRGSWLAPLGAERVDVVVSNPPYVSRAEWERLASTVRDWEPFMALVAGPSGVEGPLSVLEEAPAYLSSSGWVLLEIGEDQVPEVREAARRRGYARVTVCRDLAGRERFVMANWEGGGGATP